MRRSRGVGGALAVAVLGATVLGACAPADPATQPAAPATLDVWIAEDSAERISATQEIAARFADATGTDVHLEGVPSGEVTQRLGAASPDDLPDVVGGVSLTALHEMSAADLVDTAAVAEARDGLSERTFSPHALALTSSGDAALGVPASASAYALFYRRDLFEAAGLPAPTTYEAVDNAARVLASPEMTGIVGPSAAADPFTQATFEGVALGNGCQLVDESAAVRLDSPECVASFDFYGTLLADHSAAGSQDAESSRAAFLAGEAAMVLWPTDLLDELTGRSGDVGPTCPQCTDDPAFLARNAGVVMGVSGPSGPPQTLAGDIASWTVTRGANAELADWFIHFMLNDGYVPYLAIAPESRIPVRSGAPWADTQYADAWANIWVAPGVEEPLAAYYAPDVLRTITEGIDHVSRWAIPQGQAALLTALEEDLPLAAAVSRVTSGEDPVEVARDAAAQVRSIQDDLS